MNEEITTVEGGGPRNVECECELGDHWLEDTYGVEHRIVCGCSCAACAEY